MRTRNCFTKILEAKGREAVILDGGFGTELERQGKDYAQDPLWSARILVDDPAAVQQVHKAYYTAGADVGTTCSYQATFAGFEKAGYSRLEAEELFVRSIQLTTAARDEFWIEYQAQELDRKNDAEEKPDSSWQHRRTKPLVAFSSGPYAACLADGSEYTGDYADKVTLEQIVDFHRQKLRTVQDQEFDVIAFETLSNLKEAQAICHLLRTEPTGKPAWLSFGCKDGTSLTHGESFARDAVPLTLEIPSVIAVGVNCTPPRFIKPLLEAAVTAVKGQVEPPLLLAYPNSGEGWVNKTGKWDGNSDLQGCNLGEVGRQWVDAGARIVGGCCRTTPEYTTSLAAALT